MKTNKITVLMTDDNKASVDAILSLLAKQPGIEVTTHDDVNAYNKIQQTHPDVVRMDNDVSISTCQDKAINLETKVTNILHEIGIPAHVRGYRYIREAVMMSVENMKMLDYITKELYPNIAEKHKTEASRVERAIRHAISIACSRGRKDVIENMFGSIIKNSKKGKPTNGAFIAHISDKLRLEL